MKTLNSSPLSHVYCTSEKDTVGIGTHDDPIRIVTHFYDKKNELVFTLDPLLTND